MSPVPYSIIELLEARIAPAAVFVSPTTAKYTDLDGDLVTVRFSKPILTSANLATILLTTASGGSDTLDQIKLAGLTAASGTSISVSVAVNGDGDGLTTVGTIDATGIDLGAVNIKGDLSTIIAGDTTLTNGGLKSLTVTSFGVADTIAGDISVGSIITGSAGPLIVRTEFSGASFEVQAPTGADARLASIFVGGSVVAGSGASTGNIIAGGDVGKVTILGSLSGNKASSGLIGSDFGKVGAVTIRGSILGGTEMNSGQVFGNSIASIVVGGNLFGGTAKFTGNIFGGKIGPVTIGNAIFGGDGESSGTINSSGPIGNLKVGTYLQGGDGDDSGQIFGDSLGTVTLGSSLIGGKGDRSGNILGTGNIGAIKIGGSLSGGGTDDTTDESGEIRSFEGNIASVTVAGNASAGFNTFCGSILVGGTLGPVKIGGDIFSGGGGDFIIRAKGAPTGGNAIVSLTVGGSVSRAQILAGFGVGNVAENAAAGIGAVKVGGSWSASSIVAGVRNLGTDDVLGGTGDGFDNFNFGDSHDNNYSTTLIVPKIASITIGGAIRGSTGGTDHYGFVAGQIGSLKIDGTLIPLTPSAGTDDRLIGLTGDFRVHEV